MDRSGAVSDGVGDLVGFDADLGVRSQATPQTFDLGGGILSQCMPPVLIDVHTGNIASGRDGMYDGDLGVKLLPKLDGIP